MIRGDHGDGAIGQTFPERPAMAGRAQRRGQDVLEAVRLGVGRLIKEEVLGAGFRNDLLPAAARLADAGQPLGCGQMDDVDRGVRRLRQFEDTVDGLGFAVGRAAAGIAQGIERGLPPQAFGQKARDGVILGVYGQQPPASRRAERTYSRAASSSIPS